MKTLKKSRNKVIAGVCGGIGEYFNIDPVIIRLIWVVLTFAAIFFPGIIIYIIASLLVPSYDTEGSVADRKYENLKNANTTSEKKTSSGSVPHSDDEFNSYFK